MSCPSEIKIVVKSPAQKSEDQTITCSLDWTVSKLKQYLSQNFPMKPVSGFDLIFFMQLKW